MKILSADYVLPITSEPIENGAVAFVEDKIVDVGNAQELKENFPNAEIEDFGEAVITPGFVNCHSHLELSIMRGFLDDVEDDFFKWLLKVARTRDEKLTPEDIEISALLGAVEGARAGITCFGDIGRYGKAGLDALKRTGLRGIVFQETEFSPHNENAKADFVQLKEKFLTLKSGETALVKAAISPHAPYTVSRQLFEKITDYALAENIKLTIHAAESRFEEDLMIRNTGVIADFYREHRIQWDAPGLSSVQYLGEIGVLQAKPLLAHCIRTDEKDWELILETQTGIAHCPKSNSKFGHQTAPLESFLDNALPVGLGSDSLASNNSADILEEARFAALLARSRNDKKRHLSSREMVEIMTIGGAKAMQMENDIGSLEAGKQADLAVISLKNIARQPIHDIYASLLFASNSSDVCLTIVAGKEIYRENDFKTVDPDKLKADLKRILRKMRNT